MPKNDGPRFHPVPAVCLISALLAITGLAAFGADASIEPSRGRFITMDSYIGPSADAKPAPAGITLSLSLQTKDGAVSAGEPLVATVVLKNGTASDLNIESSGDHPPALIEITDGSGKVLASSPAPKFHRGEGITGIIPVRAGQSRAYQLIPSGLYAFNQPGRFIVKMKVYIGPDLYVPAQAPVTVTPRDSARLEDRCEELYEYPKVVPMDYDQALWRHALLTVHDDIVLPYLDLMVREQFPVKAKEAIGRIDTPRARKLLEALAARMSGKEELRWNSTSPGVMEDMGWD